MESLFRKVYNGGMGGEKENFGKKIARERAILHMAGDAFFGGRTTSEMKIIWKTGTKPIADFMPTILLKAKDFATEITIHNAKEKRMKKEEDISHEHVINNKIVRSTLISRGIVPERLPPAQDVKKIERKVESAKKKELKGILSNKKK